MRTAGKRLARVLSVIGVSMALVVPFTSPASAAPTPRNGKCEKGEFCLYYGARMTGSVSDFNGSIANYFDSQPGCYEFRGPGEGQFDCVKNNAMSARNLTTSHRVTVYFNSGHEGVSDTFLPGDARNLRTELMLDNASHKFVPM